MVAWILAIGLLVAGVVWYFYGGLSSPGVADPGASLTPGWDGVGIRGNGAESGQLHTGYSPPTGAPRMPVGAPATSKVTFVAPSTGPASATRSGVGHF